MPFPNTSLLDDFNRANGAPGGNWSGNLVSGFVSGDIASSVLAIGAFESNYWNVALGADQEVWMTIPALGSANFLNIVARLQVPNTTPQTFYLITIWQSADWYLIKHVAGTDTSLQTLGGAGSIVAGHKVGLSCIGNNLEVWRDTGGGWTSVYSTTDSSIPGGGYIGAYTGNGDWTIDNFGGGTVSSTTITRNINLV